MIMDGNLHRINDPVIIYSYDLEDKHHRVHFYFYKMENISQIKKIN